MSENFTPQPTHARHLSRNLLKDSSSRVESPIGTAFARCETDNEHSVVSPNLPPRPLMTVDFAVICPLIRPGRPHYPVFVHQAAALLHASLRPRLATTPLRFANPSPPSGWVEDFHLQAVDHARHTNKGGAHRRRHSFKRLRGYALLRRRRLSQPKPNSAEPSSVSDAGSGTAGVKLVVRISGNPFAAV